MSLPLIIRPEAEADVSAAYDGLESARGGLGRLFISRLRAVLERIETMPELHGVVWQDVRAVRVRQFRYVVYYVASADRIEVLAVLHGARDPSTWQARS